MPENKHTQQTKTVQQANTDLSGRLSGKFGTRLADNRERSVFQRKVNDTGLPDNLKSGIENLSGFAMDDVKVHYNSSQPAQLNAHAYAQGTDIHIASGQEKHLPHEAWHVVQQKQGRVMPTMQMKGRVNVNDDAGLEKEADVMGAKALQLKTFNEQRTAERASLSPGRGQPIQRHVKNFVDKVRTARELTKGMDPKKFAIGGSLAMQMWQLALDPKAKLHRQANDVDLMVNERETTRPIAEHIANEQNKDMKHEGTRAFLNAQTTGGIMGAFRGKKMTEADYKGHHIDIKEADEGSSKRWGSIDSLMMPVEDIAEEYHLPVQSPQALLAGLEKKRAAVAHSPEEVAVINEDIKVVQKIIIDLQVYQKHAQSH